MKTITFQNDGEVDIKAVTTFGASSKKEGAIGFFGTGLKYALAIALRSGCKVTLFRGLKEYSFSVRSEHIQNDDFDVVVMNDDVLSFTLELGKTWLPWQAFRELWCNARDEGGDVFPGVLKPEAGKTTIQVTGAAFVEEFYKRSEIIMQDTPTVTVNGTQIVPKQSKVFYYRGVKVHEFQKPSVLTYNNEASDLALTEDRTAKNTYQVTAIVMMAVANLTDKNLIKTVLRANTDTFEGSIDFTDFADNCSEALLDELQLMINAAILPPNKSWQKVLHRARDEKFTPRVMTTKADHQDMITEALRVIDALGGVPTDVYDINITDSLPDNVLGCVIEDKIYIADRTFARGQRMVTGTIMEELMHRHLGYEDETYTFQNYLFDKLTEALEYKADWRASSLVEQAQADDQAFIEANTTNPDDDTFIGYCADKRY